MNHYYLVRLFTISFSVALAATSFAFATGTPNAEDEQVEDRIFIQQQDPPPNGGKISVTVVRSIESDAIKVVVTFPRDADELKVSLHNLIGSQISVYPITSAVKGEVTYQFDTRGLPNGPYFVVLEALGQRITKKIMLTR